MNNNRAVPSIRWEGPQRSNFSLARVNREFEKGLIATNRFAVHIVQNESRVFPPRTTVDSLDLPTRVNSQIDSRVNICVRHCFPPLFSRPNADVFIVMQPWEYGSFPASWVHEINRKVDEIWVPSSYVRSCCIDSSISEKRVKVIPNGVDCKLFKPSNGDRGRYMSTDRFTFLYVGGLIYRKGIDCLIKAYRDAFTGNQDVLLIVKSVTNYRDPFSANIRRILSTIKRPAIQLIEADMTETELAELYASCDCLVHCYRGEGFGLTVLEGMSCGLPVIVTRGGATDDFVGENCGFKISAVKTWLPSKILFNEECVGRPWLLEPDIAELRDTLILAERNKVDMIRRGNMARLVAESGWGWQDAVAKLTSQIDCVLDG